MTEEQLKKVIEKIEDYEKRIQELERLSSVNAIKISPKEKKQITLREIVRGKKFKNGQEQIAVIVGYHEKILGVLINEDGIKSEWINAKMINKYSANFIDRAQDVLIRVHPNGTYDLTQSGEEFFENFLKNESTQATSK